MAPLTTPANQFRYGDPSKLRAQLLVCGQEVITDTGHGGGPLGFQCLDLGLAFGDGNGQSSIN